MIAVINNSLDYDIYVFLNNACRVFLFIQIE